MSSDKRESKSFLGSGCQAVNSRPGFQVNWIPDSGFFFQWNLDFGFQLFVGSGFFELCSRFYKKKTNKQNQILESRFSYMGRHMAGL